MDNNKYYWALEDDGEYFDWENWYNEDDAKYDKLWAGGNSSYSELNESLRHDVDRMLSDLASDIETTIDHADDEDWEEEELDKELVDLARDYVRRYDSKITLTDRELNYLNNLSQDYYDCYDREENELICKALKLLLKEEFITGEFRGNSQGDWLEYICPKSLEKRLDYIEAVIMGTGYIYDLTTDKYTEEEIDNGDFESYSWLTTEWRNQDVKAAVAKELNCTVAEIKIRELNGNID